MRFRMLLLLLAVPAVWAQDRAAQDEVYDEMQILARAMQLVRQDYVDEDRVDFEELTRSALRGMLSELDPHSQFLEPEDFKSMQEDTRSEFGGLGVVVGVKEGTLTIVSPMEDSPGFEAGLMPGDQILKINGQSTEKWTLPEAIERLRGEVGERVTLTIRRPSTKEVKDYDLTRAIIKVPSVKDAQILPRRSESDARIGYVRVTQFNEPTAAELEKAITKLEKEGMQGLVLDLRYNPGGLLGSAVDVCGLFVPVNTLVVSTEGRSPSREYRTTARKGKEHRTPLVVLVNYASASGSEIVAGALRDLDRALLIGETTFGKGSVQSVVSLPDGSAVRLTTAKYFTPGRNLIHEHGVEPHIRATLSDAEEVRLLRSRRRAESGSEPALLIDSQLQRAVDALQGALVYAKSQPAPGR